MLALIFVALCLAPAAARAGTYEVWSCAGPDGAPLPSDGWRAEGFGVFSTTVNDCAGGGGLYAGLNGAFDHAANSEILTWHFQVPASLKIASYRIWRAGRAAATVPNGAPVYWMTRQSNQYSGAYVVPGEQCVGCGDVGVVGSHFAAANLVTESKLADVRDLFLNASCGGENGWTCPASASPDPDTVYFRMFRAAVVLQDDSDPVFTSPPAGSLVTPGTLAGPHGVSFSATDAGSGLYQAVIEVDGQPTVVQPLSCTLPFTAVAPCKPAASPTVTLDTASLPDGAHSVRVLVTDATQTNTAAFGPFTITTSNAPSSCAATSAPNLSVSFDRKRRTISYGGRINVRGLLAGAPAGTVVRVFSRVNRAGAAARLLSAPLTTDAQGRFAYRVPAGPSRTLRFAYRGAGDPLLQCSKALAVAVRARVSLSASPRSIRPGSRVRFRGRLRGGYVPKGGKLVELQAYERGGWRSIRTVRSNAKGAFQYTYRFSFRAAGTSFPVRARVRPDSGYPWAVSTSPRVTVRVR